MFACVVWFLNCSGQIKKLLRLGKKESNNQWRATESGRMEMATMESWKMNGIFIFFLFFFGGKFYSNGGRYYSLYLRLFVALVEFSLLWESERPFFEK